MTYDPELRRSTPLAIRLKDEIRHKGPITVADYMSRCLWDEAHGYYATRLAIGRDGDFITAAEISQTFGEIIGLWAGVVWQQVLGAPKGLQLVEYGPGRGTMMRDALRAARVIPGLCEAMKVHLVEMSPELIAAQREALSDATVPIQWGHNLIGFPTPAIILANEFLDSWPVEQWIKTESGWRQRGVGLDTRGEISFVEMGLPSADNSAALRFPDAQVGALVENQRLERLADAFQTLARSGPVTALIIDYGYATAAAGDTLQAVREHKYESPLTSPGEADLSAHVSFYELASVLHSCGLAIDGPVTQAEFLGSLGIIERGSRLMHANPARAGEIETGLARLLAPNGMGTRFKAIGVRSPQLPPLPGFGSASSE